MTKNSTKETKYVVTFLIGLSVLVLGSAIVGNNILDYGYFGFLIICLVLFLFNKDK